MDFIVLFNSTGCFLNNNPEDYYKYTIIAVECLVFLYKLCPLLAQNLQKNPKG